MAVGFLFLPRFCAEVEARLLGLDEQPVAVYHRDKITSLSLSAQEAQLRQGMPLTQARAICPEVEFIPFEEDRYQKDWRKTLDICATHMSTVEPVELGEVFVDLSGLKQPSPALADLQRTVKGRTRFTCLPGCGPSKLVARIAAQAQPGKTVTSEEATDFLAPLPTSLLWSLDPKILEHLRTLGITTIGLLQKLSVSRLAEHFGRDARLIHEAARGIDHRPVEPLYPPRTLTADMSLPGGVTSTEILDNCLRRLSGELADRLQLRQEAGHRIAVMVETEDRQKASRSLRLRSPACEGRDILRACRILLDRLEVSAPVSAIAARASELRRCTSVQLNLFMDTRPQRTGRHRARTALASVTQRFGSQAVMLGAEIEIPRRERVLALAAGGMR